MGKIKVHEFATVDASIGAPMWTMDFPWTPEQTADTEALTAGATAILLGRTTYEMFAPAWSQRTVEDDPGAPFFNDTHKYVVSSTLTDPSWGPASVLEYETARITRLKEEVDGDIYVSGSASLVRALLTDGLVDELHLFVHPVMAGSGPYLGPHDGGPQTRLTLLGSTTYANGVVHLVYGPALPAAGGTQAD